MKRICERCNEEVERFYARRKRLCEKCHYDIYYNLGCSICKRKKNIMYGKFGIICRKCYAEHFRVPEKCKCGETRPVEKRTADGPICRECYRKNYERLKATCSDCNRYKLVGKRNVTGFDGPLCKMCYKTWKYNNDENFRVECLIRSRIKVAFKLYCKGGKSDVSKKYGIDFKKIIEFIGP
jgi:hypothetical protein